MSSIMKTIQLVVDEVCVDMRIDKFLSDQLPDSSRSYLQKLIKEEAVSVNGLKVKVNYKLSLGDQVILEIPVAQQMTIPAQDIPLNIVYEDAEFMIINKPQGIVVHPAPGNYEGTLVNAVLHHCKDELSGINGIARPGIVHRIDKNTSGLIVICKNDLAHVRIAEQLKDHSSTRKYEAIVYNNILEEDGTVELPIGRNPADRKQMAVNYRTGKNAVTHYKVLERLNNQFTHVELQLETGRTHQIRVHMASIRHPILGDDVYGPKNKKLGFKLLGQGQILHAKTLGFIHPTTKEYVEFTSDLPDYFQTLIEKLR